MRLTREYSDMLTTDNINQLLQQLAEGEGVDLWGSLPRMPWTQWNGLNTWRLGPRFCSKLAQKQEEPKRLLRDFISAAKTVLRKNGRVHLDLEWPETCSGWQLEELQSFIHEATLHIAVCNACAFGSPHLNALQTILTSKGVPVFITFPVWAPIQPILRGILFPCGVRDATLVPRQVSCNRSCNALPCLCST